MCTTNNEYEGSILTIAQILALAQNMFFVLKTKYALVYNCFKVFIRFCFLLSRRMRTTLLFVELNLGTTTLTVWNNNQTGTKCKHHHAFQPLLFLKFCYQYSDLIFERGKEKKKPQRIYWVNFAPRGTSPWSLCRKHRTTRIASCFIRYSNRSKLKCQKTSSGPLLKLFEILSLFDHNFQRAKPLCPYWRESVLILHLVALTLTFLLIS